MATEIMADVIDPCAVRVVDLDGDRAVHFHADGAVRFAHTCVRPGRGTIRCAPALRIGEGHTVVHDDPITIEASILCPDCGIHGWVRDGMWVPA